MSDVGTTVDDGVIDDAGDRVNGGGPASFDAFVEMLRERLNLRLDEVEVTAEHRLAEDLGFDSIAMFELFVLLEEAAGRELPSELLDNAETMADVWDWYSTLAGQHE